MVSYLTYFVSAGGGIGGISLSSVSVMSPATGSTFTCTGVLYKLPGASAHCWPSPRSIGILTVKPSARLKVSYLWRSACAV